MNNPIGTILPVVALVIMSLSVAGIWLWWQMFKDKDSQEETITEAEKIPELKVDSSFQFKPFQSLKQVEKEHLPNAVEVMRVYRDLADGTLFVQIDGKAYRNLTDFKDGETGRRFIGNARSLASMARLDKIADTVPSSTPQPSTVQPPSYVDTTQTGQILNDRKPLKLGLGKKNIAVEEVPPVIPIVDQIESLLQVRLSEHPTLRYRTIHISSVPGGVRIDVDGMFFNSIDEIPDDQVKEFIKQITQEWESRN